MKRPWVLGLAAAALLTAIAALLVLRYPEGLAGQDEQISIVHSLLLLVLVGSSAVLYRGVTLGKAVRNAAIWIVLFAVLVVGYSYRHDLQGVWQRVAGAVVPHAPVVVGDGSVVINAGSHGHFVVEAQVEGIDVRFLVDTGASDVVLSPADARRVGLDPATLSFTRQYRTANGTVAGAPVRIGRLAIGPIALGDVRASVNQADMKRSLLGMSFLSRLAGYEVAGDRLILRP